ncbi:MAG: hypothetical protein ACRDZM_16450 [Acidimicrobiia bacterium]
MFEFSSDGGGPWGEVAPISSNPDDMLVDFSGRNPNNEALSSKVGIS